MGNLLSKKTISERVNLIDKIFTTHYPKYGLSNTFKITSLTKFITELPMKEVVKAMELSIDKLPESPGETIKYFCGVCWNRIKQKFQPSEFIEKDSEEEYE